MSEYTVVQIPKECVRYLKDRNFNSTRMIQKIVVEYIEKMKQEGI